VDRRRKRGPALSEATTCNLAEVSYERVPIGADWTPRCVKLRHRFSSLAKIYRGPTFGADPQGITSVHLLHIDPALYWQPIAQLAIRLNLSRVLDDVRIKAERNPVAR
jgi:hypothetical protein